MKDSISASGTARAAAFVCLVFSASCGGTTPPPVSRLPMPASSVVASAPLSFRAPLLLGLLHANLKVPLVDVRVNGRPGRFIVDTGSTHNVLTLQFASELGIRTRPTTEEGRDHANASVIVHQAERIRLAVGPLERQLDDVIAIDAPALLDMLGVDGFLSPQRWIEHGCVVLDFPGQRMLATSESATEIRERLPRATSVHRATGAGSHAGKIVIRAALGTRAPTAAELDTGASGTEFLASYVGMAAGSGSDGGVGVSGEETKGTSLGGQYVLFAGRTLGPMTTLVRDEIRSGRESVGAIVGMDILRHFVIVIPADATEDLLVITAAELPRTAAESPINGARGVVYGHPPRPIPSDRSTGPRSNALAAAQ